MGVRGLTTYISENEKAYLKPYKLCNCYLVVDGNSTACQLYDRYSKGESAFGGDYDEYYKVVKGFFKTLEKCGVTPIVLVDGGYENRKLRTVLNRQGEKVHILRSYTKGYSPSKFFPLFMLQTFVDVTEDLGIIFIQCDLEADNELAAVARGLKCPVLSYDSDFYIFDVLYIPFPSLEREPAKDSDSGYCYIRCSIYDVTNFLNEFTGLDRSMLPIIATLLGNDYIESSTFQKFFNHVIMPKAKNKSYTQRKIDGVLHWMKKENVESATNLILTHLENKKAGVFLKAIQTSVNDYTSSTVSNYIFDRLTNQMSNICLKKKDVQSCLPLEIHQLYHQGKINKFIMNMINLGLYITQLQVEDVNYQSSYFPSLQLISDTYRILSPYSKCRGKPLTMYLVHKKFYTGFKVQNKPSDCLNDFSLDHVLKKSKEMRLKLLCEIVGVDEDEVKMFSGSWCIFIICFVYWIRKLQNEISFAHVHALILMAIANEVVQKCVGYFQTASKFMKKKGSLLLKEESSQVPTGTKGDFEGMLADVTLHEKLLLQNSLIPFRRASDMAKGKAYCISTLHLFGCFQSFVFHITQLNALLNHPLPSLKVSDFYSGTLLFNFYLAIKSKPTVDKFAINLFKDTPNLSRIYEYLLKCLCKYLNKVQPEVKKVRKKKTRKNKSEKEVIHLKADDDDFYEDVNNIYAALQKVDLN